MKRLLIMPMAIIEIVLLILNWIVAFLNQKLGKRMMQWNMRTLPDKSWYSNAESQRTAIAATLDHTKMAGDKEMTWMD